MKKFILLMLFAPYAFAVDCFITWDANDPSDQVTGYQLYVDGYVLDLAGDDTDAQCSEFTPPIDPALGRHTARVHAINEWGKSPASVSVPFGVPAAPVGLAVGK